MTLLSIVNNAQIKCGIPTTSSAYGNVDPNAVQMVRFAYEIGKDCMLRWKWLGTKQTSTFTGDGMTTLFSPPADFQTLSPSDTFISSVFPTLTMRGPVNDDDLLKLKALPVVTYPSYWRRVQSKIEFYPALQLNEVVTYSYASKYWIVAANGTTKGTWSADTDTSSIDEDLITEGVTWKWKRAKGMDYAEEFATYERMLNDLTGQENTGRTIAMTSMVNDATAINSAITLNSVSGAMLLMTATSLPLLLASGDTISLIGNI